MDWSIQEVARLAGTTSRTLRHYDAMGVLTPSRIGDNGYRYYDQRALARLQRVLILRDLGMPLAGIRDVVVGDADDASALERHLDELETERVRIERQIAAVITTIDALRGGGELMAEEMLDGFDHTVYKEEVVERWGADADAASDRWWRSLTDADKAGFQREATDIATAWAAAKRRDLPVDGVEALAIARRHRAWIAIGWQGRPVTADALGGLADMYVADPRFAKHYDVHGAGTAQYVRDGLRALIESEQEGEPN